MQFRGQRVPVSTVVVDMIDAKLEKCGGIVWSIMAHSFSNITIRRCAKRQGLQCQCGTRALGDDVEERCG